MVGRHLIFKSLAIAAVLAVAAPGQEISVLNLHVSNAATAHNGRNTVRWQRADVNLADDSSIGPDAAGAGAETTIYMRVFRASVTDLLDRGSSATAPGRCITYSAARYRIPVDSEDREVVFGSDLEDYLGRYLAGFISLSDAHSPTQTLTVVFEEQPSQDNDRSTSVLKLAQADVPKYFANAIELHLRVSSRQVDIWKAGDSAPAPAASGQSAHGFLSWLKNTFSLTPAYASPIATPGPKPGDIGGPPPAATVSPADLLLGVPLTVAPPCDRFRPVNPTISYSIASAGKLVPGGCGG